MWVAGDGCLRLHRRGYTTIVMPIVTRDSANSNPIDSGSSPHDPYRLSAFAETHEFRNFIALALYQVLMRIGWIFKTESIIMPAVLDTITGGGPLGGLLRGCLPVLNRFGHSIPPMLFSRRLKILPQKRSAAFVCSLCMATVFLMLSTVWRIAGTEKSWLPWFFLGCYVAFFSATGINNLAVGTLQGKLIHATRRGRLLLTSNVLEATSAVIAAFLLLPHWLTSEGGRFEMIFGFTGLCFVLSAISLLITVEERDRYEAPDRGVRHLFSSAYGIIRSDRRFRRLAFVAMAFGSSLMLFPHYQALGRSPRLSLSFNDLLVWVIVQNMGTALFSLIIGPIADRHGNRAVLRLIMVFIAAMPVSAIALSHWPTWGPTLYPGIFLFIGLTPVGFKTMNNYTLEISRPEDHPHYLSTLGLCFAVPLLLSPALGWIVEATNFETVFFTISVAVLAGWFCTFRLEEPRHALRGNPSTTPIVPDDD